MSLFSNSVWIGGVDPGNTLHFAGERYRQGTGNPSWVKHDYRAGPVIDTNGYKAVQDAIRNRIWKISKTEIDYHRAHYWEQGYVAPRDILEWRAHGDVSLGQAVKFAPLKTPPSCTSNSIIGQPIPIPIRGWSLSLTLTLATPTTIT